MDSSEHRPLGFERPEDAHLFDTVRHLRRLLLRTQRKFAHETLKLIPDFLGDLAEALVDFAEDLHCGTGIWQAYERYNIEFFGTALPLTTAQPAAIPVDEIHADRIRHFLWIVYPQFLDGLLISPKHADLVHVAGVAGEFLANAFSGRTTDSGIKDFLGSTNEFGWNVKKKLVWLGCHSFMFRTMFANYMMEENRDKTPIGSADDFVCQESTTWSGLGVPDILAAVLDISADDRIVLRSWYERHLAYYRIDSVSADTLETINVVSDQPYRVRIDMKNSPFRRGQLIFGSVVSWRGEWYWSGTQQLLGIAADLDVDALVKRMRRENPEIVCRYDKAYEALVRERFAEVFKQMLAFYGRDLMVYPDGLSMAADWQEEFRRQWESMPKEQVKDVMKRYGLKKFGPEMNIPKNLIEEKDGLGVFLNPEIGKEIMRGFTPLISGLKRKGKPLAEEQADPILDFMHSTEISPAFARRVFKQYGDEPVRTAFALPATLPEYWLEYLLRSRKGSYYRKRYPSLAVI